MGEFDWVRKSMTKVRRISYVFITGFIVVAFLFKNISRIWLGVELDYQDGVIGITCLFYIMEVVNLVFVQFYYGMGDVKQYMILTIFQALAMLPLAYLFSIPLGFGVAGVKIAGAVVLAVSGAALPFMTYRKLNSCELKWREKEGEIE